MRAYKGRSATVEKNYFKFGKLWLLDKGGEVL